MDSRNPANDLVNWISRDDYLNWPVPGLSELFPKAVEIKQDFLPSLNASKAIIEPDGTVYHLNFICGVVGGFYILPG